METETYSRQHAEETEEDLLLKFKELIPTFSPQTGGLIPALQTAQNLFGYLPESVLQLISRSMKIPYSEVTGVVSFLLIFLHPAPGTACCPGLPGNSMLCTGRQRGTGGYPEGVGNKCGRNHW